YFTDVTASSGLAGPLQDSYGFTVKFVDMDGDHDNDLLWVSDFGTGRYFRNEGGGHFVDFTAASGTMLEDTEMGVTINDFNEDGLLDFWVTTVVENGFYVNLGDNVFDERAEESGVRNSGWGWGAISIDWNHDTLVDMIGTSWEGHHYAFLNVSNEPADLLFQDVHESIGLQITSSGRGLSNLDYDNDGDQDFAVFTWFTDFRLYRNDLAHRGTTNWLRVALDRGCSDTVPPDGFGAIVRARIGDRTQTRLLDGGSNYLSNSEFSAHFGLGANTAVDELVVEWPDGVVTTLTDVAVNQFLTVLYPPTRSCFRLAGAGCGIGEHHPRIAPRFGAAPALGAMFFLDAFDIPTTAPLASLLISLEAPDGLGTDLASLGAPGCRLFPSGQILALPKRTIAGFAQWRMDIPAIPEFDGLEFVTQMATIDIGDAEPRIGLSNALYGVCK
ncbi:MAG: CRTAC1 family protein, partial [Planctomycetes bacterium]|nr:CRTAC1 family protein [Planctomycetota bacterium]